MLIPKRLSVDVLKSKNGFLHRINAMLQTLTVMSDFPWYFWKNGLNDKPLENREFSSGQIGVGTRKSANIFYNKILSVVFLVFLKKTPPKKETGFHKKLRKYRPKKQEKKSQKRDA